MLRAVLAMAGLALCLAGADQKPKASKADIAILEAAAHRGEGLLNLDGRLRNSGDRPIRNLVLTFDFAAPGRVPLTSQSAAVDEELLLPGAEASFHMQLASPPRAVEFRISAADESRRGLRVSRAGPYPID